MKKLKLAYFGTNDFSGTFLNKILANPYLPVEVCVVVTQPDKPVGRKQMLYPSPVKVVALKNNINVYDGSIKDFFETIKDSGLDIGLLYSYGEIIPSSLLEIFPIGFWNIHPSLLPLYRNVAPMVYPLVLGDTETGVTIIELDEKLDHGAIIGQERYQITANDRRTDLETVLSELGYSLFEKLITDTFISGKKPQYTEQDHSAATFTKKLKKESGFVAFPVLKKMLANEPLNAEEFPHILQEYWVKYPSTKKPCTPAEILFNIFRGLSPWPGIWTTVLIKGQEKRLKMMDMKLEDGKCYLKQVQLEGKNTVDYGTFNRAYCIF